MYPVSYLILNVFLLFLNNVECVTLTNMTELSTTINSTNFINYDIEELAADNDENSSGITPIFMTTPLSTSINNYWMAQMGIIKDDLLRIQAIIVKDEDAEKVCTKGSQKSLKRYLMCAGSILNRNRVLTSASCVHEAMHIRHNVQAPLAVIIAPLKSTVQMIRVRRYSIHPQHDTNPHSPNYSKHNLAILNLECRISSENYYKVELPNQAMSHICTEENCFIAIYRKIGHTSNVVYQISAPEMLFQHKKRRRSVNYIEKNINLTNFSTGSNLNSEITKIIRKRSSDGSNGCSQTGAPVMINNTQTALVAFSCDDRQKSGDWAYTDLYKNLDWIHGELYNWNKTSHATASDQSIKHGSNFTGTNSKACGNCVFNFYISVGCKEKGNCPKNITNQSSIRSNVLTKTNHPLNQQPSNRHWMQAPKAQPLWNHGQVLQNDIPRLLRSSLNQCPNNSPECLVSLKKINGVQKISPFQQIQPHRAIKNQSQNNNPTKYNILYHKKNRAMEILENPSQIYRRKPDKILNIEQNIYKPINIERNKPVQDKMGNWLRRRQVIPDQFHRDT